MLARACFEEKGSSLRPQPFLAIGRIISLGRRAEKDVHDRTDWSGRLNGADTTNGHYELLQDWPAATHPKPR